MFFILSKVLYFLVTPIVWVLGLLVASIWVKHGKWKKRLQWSSLAVLAIFSNPLIYNGFIQWWEVETITAEDISKPYDVAILLGGFGHPYGLPSEQHFRFGTAANRFTQTLELYRTGKIKKILLTGGAADLMQKMPAEAEQAAVLLGKLGVPASNIIIEPNARNTRENAIFTADLLAQEATSTSYLLITSAAHLPRAKACFDKAGIAYTPYAVDHHAEFFRWEFQFLLQPSAITLERWAKLIKEWIGYGVYKIVGYI